MSKILLSTVDVDVIMNAKDSVARSRDTLSRIIRYLAGELAVLAKAKKSERIRNKINDYRNIISLITYVDKAVIEIRKPTSELRLPSVLKNLRETLDFLTANVKALKNLISKTANDVIHKFRGISTTFDEMLENAKYLKALSDRVVV